MANNNKENFSVFRSNDLFDSFDRHFDIIDVCKYELNELENEDIIDTLNSLTKDHLNKEQTINFLKNLKKNKFKYVLWGCKNPLDVCSAYLTDFDGEYEIKEYDIPKDSIILSLDNDDQGMLIATKEHPNKLLNENISIEVLVNNEKLIYLENNFKMYKDDNFNLNQQNNINHLLNNSKSSIISFLKKSIIKNKNNFEINK